MNTLDIIRAWKDVEYRRSLSAAEQALVPEHPAGAIELADEELEQVDGGATNLNFTGGCCPPTINVPCTLFTLCPTTPILL